MDQPATIRRLNLTTIADELEALLRQLAVQQQLLAQNEAQLKNQILLLSEKDRELERKQCQLDECNEHIAWLEETLALLKSQRYRHSSEKLDGLQGLLSDESEMDASIREIQERLDKEKKDHEAKRAAQNQERAAKRPPEDRPRRKPLPDQLRRLDVDVDVSAEDKHAKGDEWEFIGWECSEQLACQEREYFVKRIRRARFVRKQQNPLDKSDGIKVAPVLPVMLPRAIADAGLLAEIVTARFVDALPFNRECKVLDREGVDISYSVLSAIED